MDTNEAKRKLMVHGAFTPISEDWSKGFLGSLKPYTGPIPDEVLLEIIECLRLLFSEINGQEKIDSRIVAGIHGVLHTGNMWVCNENSSLRRSGRIEKDEVTRVKDWLDEVSNIYHSMLWVKCSEKYLFEKYEKGN